MPDMSSARMSPPAQTARCPICQSRATVEEHIVNPTFDDVSYDRFYPRGIRLLTLTRSVALIGRRRFQACTKCGLVWSQVDAAGLRELIESKGSDDLQRRIADRCEPS